MWHFARTEIPADITAKKPNPSSWGNPVAFWSSSSCDMASHFFEHTLVLDTTICGDFAGATYASAGCPGTCAQAVSNPSTFSCGFFVFSLEPFESLQFMLCSGQVETELHCGLSIIFPFTFRVATFFSPSICAFHARSCVLDSVLGCVSS